jgi:hypothetical protein
LLLHACTHKQDKLEGPKEESDVHLKKEEKMTIGGNVDAIMFLALLLYACTHKQDKPKEGLKEETHKLTKIN